MTEIKIEIEKIISSPDKLNRVASEILKHLNKNPTLSNAIDQLSKEHEDISDNDEQFLSGLPKRKGKITNEFLENMTKKDQKEFLIKSEQKNLRTIQKIKEKLKTAMKKDKQQNRYGTMTRKMLAYVKDSFDFNTVIYHENEDIDYNTELLNQLKTLFNQIRSQKIRAYANKGKKPVINRFIQARLGGNTKDIFVTKRATNNLTFNFVVDQSGSMGGNTKRVSRLVKTFFKAIEDIAEIKINVIGYESMRINTVINNPNDLWKISYCGGSTPTCQAMTYAQSLIKKQTGKNVLMLLSDGYADGISGYLNTEKYLKYIVDDLKQNNNVDSFALMIGGGNFESFAQIFGKNFAEFSNIDSANDELIKIFKQFIDEYLRCF